MQQQAYDGWWLGEDCAYPDKCLIPTWGPFAYVNRTLERVSNVWFYRPDQGNASDGAYIRNINLLLGVNTTGESSMLQVVSELPMLEVVYKLCMLEILCKPAMLEIYVLIVTPKPSCAHSFIHESISALCVLRLRFLRGCSFIHAAISLTAALLLCHCATTSVNVVMFDVGLSSWCAVLSVLCFCCW